MKINMNAQLNKGTFKNFYYDHKEYLVPIVSITISAFLLLFFILPQISSFSEKNKEKNTEVAKLDELKKTTSIASTADLKKLDSDLALASGALPAGKDFEKILGALSSAASNTNVAIVDYQFQDSGSLVGSVQKFPALSFKINLLATPAQAIDFTNKLYESLPLSETSTFSYSKDVSSLTILFYYKPFAPVGSEEKVTIERMNDAQSQTLDTISGWASKSIGVNDILPSSESAKTSSPFQ